MQNIGIAFLSIAVILTGIINLYQGKTLDNLIELNDTHNKQIDCLEQDLVYVFEDFCAKLVVIHSTEGKEVTTKVVDVDKFGNIIRENK